MPASPREEACLILGGMVEVYTEGFVNVANEAAARPADRALQVMLTRAIVELDRLARLQQSICRPRDAEDTGDRSSHP